MATEQFEKQVFSWVIADEVWHLKSMLANERDCARRSSLAEAIQEKQQQLSKQAMLEYRSAFTN